MKYTKEEINEMMSILDEMHPSAHCELNYNSPFELLVAVILSAQCTDKRVNEVTKNLFARYNTADQIANISIEELEQLIKPCGFYRNKAINIKNCSIKLIQEYNSVVPDNIDELMKLPGVGRKTANVVYSEAYNGQAIAVDTHVLRVSNRIGFIKSDDPLKVEEKLMQIFPKESWTKMHHLLIFLGRYTCYARNPKCNECKLNKYCKYYRSKY